MKTATAEKLVGINNPPILPDLGPNANPVGQLCAANESRFESTYYSEPLTAFTVGWVDPENLDALIEELFPAVEVGRRFEFKAANNAESFLSETDDIRAIGSPFKRIEYTGSSVNEKTHNKGLTMRVDHDDEVGEGWQERYTQLIMQRLLRNDFRRAIALIDAAATSVAEVWSAATNPDGDIRGVLRLSADSTGVRPNTVAFGEAAWDLRADAYEAQDTPYAGRAASMTPEQLAAKYMVDRVRIVKARYQSAAAAKAAIIPATVYSYIAIPGATKDDASNVKRFITPARGGRFGVYVMEYEKFTDISVEHYSNTVITGSAGIRKTPVTAS